MTQQPGGEDGGDAYHGYSVDPEDQPQSTGDSEADNDRGLVDPLDEGYSPPDRWSVGEGYGNTPREEALGESLDQRLAQEEPEPDAYAEPPTEDADDVNEVEEVGDVRAGRLVAEDEGSGEDDDDEMYAGDVGIDGAGAGAEEAAIHIIEEDPSR